jgi:hypothetical protein
MRVVNPARISRSLVTILFLTFIQVVAAPILTPTQTSPAAQAATFDSSGLILKWDMQDLATNSGSGTSLGDASFNSSTGTLSKAGTAAFPTYTSSTVKYLTIAGTGTNYNFVKSGNLKPKLDATSASTMQNISIFAWVYPTGNGIVVDEHDQNFGWQDSQIEMADGKFSFRVWGSNEIISETETPLNYWYYVGLTYDFSTLTLRAFINGKEVGKQTGLDRQSPWESNANFEVQYSVGRYDPTNLGSASGGNFRFGALQIYNKPISQSVIVQNYEYDLYWYGPSIGNPANKSQLINRNETFSVTACAGMRLAAACNYKWEASSDTGTSWNTVGTSSTSYALTSLAVGDNGKQFRVTATDPGALGNVPISIQNYAVSNPATLTVSVPPGSDTDTALTFSAGKYAWAPDSNEFDIANAITIQAWVYQTESLGSSWNMVVNKESSYELGTIAGTWYFGLRSTGWAGKDTEVPTKYNAWQHVALTRASGSSTANFYVDGQLRWSGTADGAGVAGLANTTQPFTIGGRSGDGETFSSPFAGQIDELRVFNSARTASEIQSDMRTYGPINTSSLAVYYDFNEGKGSKLYNRVSGATSGSDLTVVNSPAWDESMIESTTVSGAYTIKRFLRNYLTSNNGWKVPTALPAISALVVGGGGGGGYNSGGGGSGGGLVYTPRTVVSGTMTVTVGVGGEGASSTGAVPLAGFTTAFGTTTAAGGNPGGNYPTSQLGGSGVVTSTATSGSGGRGAPNDSSSGSAGSLGYQSAISGTTTRYSGGGGGGGWGGNTGGGAGGDGGGGAGGVTNSRAGKNGTTNTGGGGGGGSSAGFLGGDGGSGVIIVRWISAARPIFTQPTNDTTTAGLTDTITVSNNPNSPLIRNFQWQRSIDTGTTWSNITTGSGITSNTYTTPI